MKPNVFIDGRVGTTGLQIESRLQGRCDIELLSIPEEMRKDEMARRDYLNRADIVFLCLPDEAAKHAVTLIENPNTRVIDASSAHRTSPGWAYGFPELSAERRAAIRTAERVTNPGCHATGFLAIAAPLVAGQFIAPDTVLACYSLTGYSGGGKEMIAAYESDNRPDELNAPRIYGQKFLHKHMPEMTQIAGLRAKPLFSPIVADYYKGMAISVMLRGSDLQSAPTTADLRDFLFTHYSAETFVTVAPLQEEPAFWAANAHTDTNKLEICISGDGDYTILTARLDNLGKGASGAAVQNMNLMLGFDETAGL